MKQPKLSKPWQDRIFDIIDECYWLDNDEGEVNFHSIEFEEKIKAFITAQFKALADEIEQEKERIKASGKSNDLKQVYGHALDDVLQLLKEKYL